MNYIKRTIRLPWEAYSEISIVAHRRGVTQQEVIEDALAQGLLTQSPTEGLSAPAARRLRVEAMRRHKPITSILNDLVLKSFPEEQPKK